MMLFLNNSLSPVSLEYGLGGVVVDVRVPDLAEDVEPPQHVEPLPPPPGTQHLNSSIKNVLSRK